MTAETIQHIVFTPTLSAPVDKVQRVQEFAMKFTQAFASLLARCRMPLVLSGLLLGLSACTSLSSSGAYRDKVAVGVVGVQHLGPDFNIATFYIDDAGGSNVGRSGGGGGSQCCGTLPRTWRPDMTAVVRWSVGDWSQENRAEIEAGNYQSVRSGGVFIATVPIEKYDEPHDVFVHFFPGGKVRVTTRLVDKIPSIPHDDPTATQGVRVKALFTPEELDERARKRDEQRARFGDWR